MPGEMGECRSGRSIEVCLERENKEGCDVDISKGDAVADEEGACAKESIQDTVCFCSAFVKGLLNLGRERLMSKQRQYMKAVNVRTGLL